jgi:2'-5' RNA ligase
MSSKTHRSAMAVVPPQGVRGPIQAIRARHDRQFHRWPPHVNLLYPFYPPEQFGGAVPRLAEACAQILPVVVTLSGFRSFQHSSRKATIWLAPEPREGLVRLQAALQAACPGCDDLSRFAAGFTPHLSVGQAGPAEEVRRLLEALQRAWEPINFELSAVALLLRERETPFEVGQWIPLGARP